MDPVIITTESKIRGLIAAAVETSVGQLAPRFAHAAENRPDKGWLTNREAQDYLGLSKATLARYRADGTLAYSKVGASVYYRLADVEAVLAANAVGARSRHAA